MLNNIQFLIPKTNIWTCFSHMRFEGRRPTVRWTWMGLIPHLFVGLPVRNWGFVFFFFSGNVLYLVTHHRFLRFFFKNIDHVGIVQHIDRICIYMMWFWIYKWFFNLFFFKQVCRFSISTAHFFVGSWWMRKTAGGALIDSGTSLLTFPRSASHITEALKRKVRGREIGTPKTILGGVASKLGVYNPPNHAFL